MTADGLHERNRSRLCLHPSAAEQQWEDTMDRRHFLQSASLVAASAKGRAESIRMPYLCAAGEHDELSPLTNTERLLQAIKGPKRFVVYQDARHATAGVPSTNLGPYLPALVADWLGARFKGESFPSERWFVDATGRVSKTPI